MTIFAHADNNAKYNNTVGYYRILNPDKTDGEKSYQYKSKLERAMMAYCDKNPKVIKWKYEPNIPIHYKDYSSIDPKTGALGKDRKYYIDFVLIVETYKRTYQTIYVEVKSYRETVEPTKRSTNDDKKIWIRNQSKWKAARKLCESKGYKFQIITEREFNAHY